MLFRSSMPPFTFLPQPSPNVSQAATADGTSSHKTSPTTSSSDPQQHQPGSYVAHLHHAHGAMLSPYTPFSPGVAMSPGAFWGRPGSGPNPYINPAVGAPVHSYFPPVPPRAQPAEEYFPPFPSTSSTSRPSGLANEIQPDQSSAGGTEETTFAAVSGQSPDSVVTSNGTAGTPNGTEISPRPQTPSSRGTSYQTDSGKLSPMQDVTKEMEALNICRGSTAAEKNSSLIPRSQSAQALSPEMASTVRADADAVKGGASANVVDSNAHIPPRLGLGISSEGRQVNSVGS